MTKGHVFAPGGIKHLEKKSIFLVESYTRGGGGREKKKRKINSTKILQVKKVEIILKHRESFILIIIINEIKESGKM